MSVSDLNARAAESDLLAATLVFEQIALRDGLHVDRSKVRRAVDEAAETYFGMHEGGWWRWIVETGHSGRALSCPQSR